MPILLFINEVSPWFIIFVSIWLLFPLYQEFFASLPSGSCHIQIRHGRIWWPQLYHPRTQFQAKRAVLRWIIFFSYESLGWGTSRSSSPLRRIGREHSVNNYGLCVGCALLVHKEMSQLLTNRFIFYNFTFFLCLFFIWNVPKNIYTDFPTQKNGTKVSGACIRSVRKSGTKRADEDQKILRLRAKKTQRAHRIAGRSRSCLMASGSRKLTHARHTLQNQVSGSQKTITVQVCENKPNQRTVARKPIILRRKEIQANTATLIYKTEVIRTASSPSKKPPRWGRSRCSGKWIFCYVFIGKHPNLRKIYKKDKDWVQKNYELKAFTQ